MTDEISEARRQRARGAQDITPRDAILEGLAYVDADRDQVVGRAEHAFVIIMTRTDEGNASMMVASGGSRNSDEIIGILTRVATHMAAGGMQS